MKVLLITVAGMSSRFSKTLGRESLKCIYYDKRFDESLLYNMINKDSSFDKYVVVGGYKFDELKSAIDADFASIKDKIVLLDNEHYFDYGSGYSLYVGLKYLMDTNVDEVVFAEGDLWVDGLSFEKVSNSTKDVITYNRDTIDSKKSVVFYYDTCNKAHYLYDTSHNCLEISQPFLSIYNSGQIWKFNDKPRMKSAFESLTADEWKGTNLVFIQRYFGELNKNDYELIEFKQWLNCNTIQDFRKMLEVKNEDVK